MICSHSSAEFDDEKRTARCLICGAVAPGRYLIDKDGDVIGFRVDAWKSDAWVDTPPRIFTEPRADA